MTLFPALVSPLLALAPATASQRHSGSARRSPQSVTAAIASIHSRTELMWITQV